jgi:hypothetical protein
MFSMLINLLLLLLLLLLIASVKGFHICIASVKGFPSRLQWSALKASACRKTV